VRSSSHEQRAPEKDCSSARRRSFASRWYSCRTLALERQVVDSLARHAGRTLGHTAVVRALQRGGTIPAAADHWTNEVPVSLNGSWRRPRVVAFVQDARSRRILAAGVLEEERDGAAAERDQRGADDQAHGAKKAHAP